MEKNGNPVVIWLHFQECTGCTESLIRSTHPTVPTLILDMISLDYHETLMAGSGHQAEKALHDYLTFNRLPEMDELGPGFKVVTSAMTTPSTGSRRWMSWDGPSSPLARKFTSTARGGPISTRGGLPAPLETRDTARGGVSTRWDAKGRKRLPTVRCSGSTMLGSGRYR